MPDTVQKVVQEDGCINPFINGRPGHLWFKGLCAETQKKRKRSLTSKRWKELRDAEEQENLLKERRKEKERYKVVRKEREKQTNEGDWECRACNSSFSQDEENGNKCKWIQCM